MENRLAVKKSLSRAILYSKALSKDKEDLMVVFMLSNIKEIFMVRVCCHDTLYFSSPWVCTSTHQISHRFLKGEGKYLVLYLHKVGRLTGCPLYLSVKCRHHMVP